jgi:hypothetical protein
MSRGITRTITMVLVLITVFLLVSPGVFANTFVQIDDEGLKGMQIRADIYKKGQVGGTGPKHGRVQIIIREMDIEQYSLKFLLDLKKATPDTEYSICLWANLPDIEFTIHGDGSNFWYLLLEPMAGSLGFDKSPGNNDIIETSLGLLGLTQQKIEHDTGMDIMTDNRGTYKDIKTGGMTQDELMMLALNIAWPILREYAIDRYPILEAFLPEEVDFATLHIIGVTIPANQYTISGGLEFVGRDPEDPNPDNIVDEYVTETITINHYWEYFEWWV